MSSNERFFYTSVDDPLARPLFDGLEQEYDSRYADVRRRIGGSAREELQRYPAQAFAAPVGAFVLLLRDGVAISGGAFMPHRDPDTAEFKRIWTLPGLRRQGIAHRLVEKAVSVAEEAGCRRVWGSMHDDDVRDLCPGSPLRTPNDVTAGPTTFVIPIP